MAPLAARETATLRVERGASGAAARGVATFDGALTFATTGPLWARAEDVAREADAIDLSGVTGCDTAGAALVAHVRRRAAAARGRTRAGAPGAAAEDASSIPVTGANAQVASTLAIVEGAETAPISAVAPEHEGAPFFERVGERMVRTFASVRNTFEYIGDVTAAFAAAARHPGSVRWRDVFLYMSRAGADALPIVALINGLMGVILAFQGVNLLGKLGFDSYTPDAVAVSVVLELGPLMTAIIVAGRSGSAFAAEIGTMTVNEEVDALRTMGLDRTRFLVVPKIIALLAMMPLLVVFADACGLMGGLLIGTTAVDMTIAQYLRQSLEHIDLWGASQGLIKGEAYAVCIASVGCLRGLQTRQGAQGVGLAATSAVVSSIFLVIVCDAILTVIFHFV